MPLFKRPQQSPFELPDEWQILDGMNDGKPMLVRRRIALEPARGHRDFPVQLGIAVPFLAPLPNGFPGVEEDRQLGGIEEMLSEDLERTQRAVLVAVITTAGMREFVLYTSSTEWIQGWLLEFSQRVNPHEVQAMSQPDPDWNVFGSLGPAPG